MVIQYRSLLSKIHTCIQTVSYTHLNPKEGDYTVVQKYNDDFDITVTIHVTPINLIGFTAENENLTYWTGAADYPATIDDLKLAPKAKPILDKYIPNGGVPEFNIG